MPDSFAELIRRMRPPIEGGDVVDWQRWRERLGFEFPADYKRFIEIFGSGTIDSELLILRLVDDGEPFVSENEQSAEMFDPFYNPAYFKSAYPTHTGIGGLVCWAVTSGPELCYWFARGENPDNWPVVVFSMVMDQWLEYEGGMADFLVSLFQGDVTFPFTMGFPTSDRPDYLGWRAEQKLIDRDLSATLYRSDPLKVIREITAAGLNPVDFYASASRYLA